MGQAHVTDDEFDDIISSALEELPKQYTQNMKNVAIVMADDPTPEQRDKLNLHCNQTLYGLYEGIPLTKRGANYNLVLPDKITIFKNPILYSSPTKDAFKAQVKHTLWHEIAHHYGLDHDRIHEIERTQFK